MKLDILVKVRHFGTSTPGEFHWPEGIQIVAHQYGTKLSTDDVKHGQKNQSHVVKKKSFNSSLTN